MSRLFCAEHIARTTNFQISHGNLESGAKFCKFPHRIQALLRNIRQCFSALERKICKRMARRASDTAAQLVQLRQAHMIGVLDNQRIGIRNVNTCLNNCRTHEHINVAVTHARHDARQLPLAHLSVRHRNFRIRQHFFEFCRTRVNGTDLIVQIIGLSAAVKFPPHGLRNDTGIIFHHIGLYRMPILRRFFEHRHIANTGQSHIQRARNRRCGQREHIHLPRHLFEFFFV